MKKTLLTALIVSASVCSAIAQEQKPQASQTGAVAQEADQKSLMAKRAQEWKNLLATELKLTDEQSKKIAELDKAFGERRVAIENNATLTDEAKKERKMALLKAKDAQFAQLLTPEQQVRYKELVEARATEASKKDN